MQHGLSILARARAPRSRRSAARFRWRAAMAACSALVALAWPQGAAAQFDFKAILEKLAPTGAGPASAVAPSPAASAVGRNAAQLGEALKPNAAALGGLAVDRQCQKVEEKFDVFEKAYEYAGEQGQQRLQRIIASDFEFAQLTDDDKKMLRYLAYTTVWVPASVENKVGGLYAGLKSVMSSDTPTASGRTQKKAMERMDQRLQELKGALDGFDGGVRLVLDKDVRDGAFAQVGGLVVVSPRFLSLMDESDGARDVVLAHELSHLYKRHSLKQLQYQLVSNAAGFSLVKRLFRRINPNAGLQVMPDFVFYAQVSSELLESIQKTNVAYGKEQELEADACAIGWLARASVEPREAWQVFGALLATPADPADVEASYQQRHPSPAERDANIQLALGKGSGKPASADPKAQATQKPTQRTAKATKPGG